jgi:4-hydroxy-3-methylbut-2-enyl diphosphate reductase IspH
MFENINKIGITGATSTPMWLMEKIEEWLHQNV